MKPYKIKDIAKRFISEYYPNYLKTFDELWGVLEELDFNMITSDKGIQSRLGEGLSLGGESSLEYKEVMAGNTILYLALEETKGKENISEAYLLKCIETVCKNKLRNINPNLKEKVISSVNYMFSSFEGDTHTSSAKKKATKLEINFTETKVILSNKNQFNKTYPFIILENIILQERIHWLWGFIFLGKWTYMDTRKLIVNPKQQFGNYISKFQTELSKILQNTNETNNIAFVIEKERGGDECWIDYKLVKTKILCNLFEARDMYLDAKEDYDKSRTDVAVKRLESALSLAKYKNLKYIDAYKLLINCIFKLDYVGISDELLIKVETFLRWYKRRLKDATIIIRKVYLKNNFIPEEYIEDELNYMEIEYKEAEKHYEAIQSKISLSSNVKDYEYLIALIQNLRETYYEYLIVKQNIEETIFDTGAYITLRQNKHIANIFEEAVSYLTKIRQEIQDKEGTIDSVFFKVIMNGVDFEQQNNLASLINCLKNLVENELNIIYIKEGKSFKNMVFGDMDKMKTSKKGKKYF